ncbi:MAG TPA: cytochrome C oxidase subunit I [Burkholderiaceae bacterium]|nr:cytochrome C oxidase subunit I [Burkholderiaceae bacterium]
MSAVIPFFEAGAVEPAATRAQFALPTAHPDCQRLAAGWMWVSFSALVGAGLFALLIVLARTPYVSSLFPTVDFFRSALVVHVDLSVLVWFFAFAGVLWSAASPPQWLTLGWAALTFTGAGALMLVLSPFIATGGPLMNNYIPVLQNRAFLAGLVLFGFGVGMAAFRGLVTLPGLLTRTECEDRATRFGLHAAAFATAMALLAYSWAFATIPFFVRGLAYCESLFWGGGHVMQFAYTSLMLVAWLWLATEVGARVPLTARVTTLFFALGVAPVLATPLIYLSYPTHSFDNMEAFTKMMRVGGGFAALPLGLAVTIGLWRSARPNPQVRPQFTALLWSLLLFAFGGGISFLIRESNTIITAHYHATGGAVSVAFMGAAYALLPRIGFGRADAKLARWQPTVYGVGQFFHILGLLWSGGYGVQRKVAGADQALHGFAQIAGMGLMGLGGLIAVVGGLMFLLVVFRAMRLRAR